MSVPKPTAEFNRAPEWRPGMGEIEGMAAHPSLQVRTTTELRRKLEQIRAQHAEDDKLPDSPEKRELMEREDKRIAAYELALKWRCPTRDGRCADCGEPIDNLGRVPHDCPTPWYDK